MTASISDDVRAIEEALAGKVASNGRFKPTPGEWVMETNAGWKHPQTEVRAPEWDCKVLVVRADFTCTVGKSEYEWANAAFVAAAHPARLRRVLDTMQAMAGALKGLLSDPGEDRIRSRTWDAARSALALYEGKQ